MSYVEANSPKIDALWSLFQTMTGVCVQYAYMSCANIFTNIYIYIYIY